MSVYQMKYGTSRAEEEELGSDEEEEDTPRLLSMYTSNNSITAYT